MNTGTDGDKETKRPVRLPTPDVKSGTGPLGSRTVAEDVHRAQLGKLDASFRRQTFDDFITKDFPPKEPLIEGILYRRDRVSVTGRGREGKTTLISNVALAGSMGRPHYLGFSIPKPFNVLCFYLEDDPGELQEKLRRMGKEASTERFHLYTIDDFFRWNIPIDVKDSRFREFVRKCCDDCKPDLIIWDNLAHLVGADYNNSKSIHELMMFMFRLEHDYNTATLIAAHPRKGSRLDNDVPLGARATPSLFSSPEKSFEECMGSSHFINTTGSLWGIERDHNTGQTRLILGAQRLTGGHTRTVAEKNDDDWFERIDDFKTTFGLVCTTEKRKQAWELLPEDGEFSQAEVRALVKKHLKSNGSFQPWWDELRRHSLVVPVGEKFRKRNGVSP